MVGLILGVLRVEVGPTFEPVVLVVECSYVCHLVKPCNVLAIE